MEVDLQSLFGLRVTWCAQLYSLAETPLLRPPPALGLVLWGRYWSAKIDDISLLPGAVLINGEWSAWIPLRAESWDFFIIGSGVQYIREFSKSIAHKSSNPDYAPEMQK